MSHVGNERQIIFDPFCLDLDNECLWRGQLSIKLRPKAFAVLKHLLARPGKLVTKEELLGNVWPETFVGEAVLKVTVRQIREALEDDPKTPRFIETAHRRGYRFIGQIGTERTIAPDRDQVKDQPLYAVPVAGETYAPRVVGREQHLARMRECFEKMLAGERQVLFVTGEAGIGKTALVDAFAKSVASHRIRIRRGQCLEHYGTSEAYLPVLEAIGRLCREERHLVDVLRAHAPMWLLQMPALISDSDGELIRGVGATRERMLREMGDALEAFSADLPLILILEDLHWSDYSTLDLITYLASQRQPAQFMLIGTYRTAELIASGHPLNSVKQELLAKHQCDEMSLEYLSEETINRYLSVRFPDNRFPPKLACRIHHRTEGNPLFMVNAVDYLVAEELIAEHESGWELVAPIDKVELGVPDGIKQMIEKQINHLNPDQQRTLEAASVAGAEFPTLALVAGLDEDRAIVEARCDELARHRHFIQDCGVQVMPNGEAVSRYGFIHALYQNVLYERVPPSRRSHLHRRIAEEGVQIYGDRVREIAAELAMHFERSSNYQTAVKYLREATENAIRRFAYREAVGLGRRGLELLGRLPDTPERAKQELWLHIALGMPLIGIQGYASDEVGKIYKRARELCHQLGDTPGISQALSGLWSFYAVRGELNVAREIAEEFLRLAERLPYPGMAMRGHLAMEVTVMHQGEFDLAMEHFEKALRLYESEQHHRDAFSYTLNQGVGTRCQAVWALWFLGRADEALNLSRDAMALARELGEPNALAHASFYAAILYQLRGETSLAREHAETTLAVASQHGLVMYKAFATNTLGWLLVQEGRFEQGIEQMKDGLAAQSATGTSITRPHFLALLAEGLGKAQRYDEGLAVLEEGVELANRTGEKCYLSELYRVKGELLLRHAANRSLSAAAVANQTTDHSELPYPDAENCFQQSIRLARQQNAKSWELRAAMSMGRLYQRRGRSQGKRKEARDLVERVYASFSEGFDTADLREAKTLLDNLS